MTSASDQQAGDDYDVETRSPHIAASRKRFDELNAALDLKAATLDVAYADDPRERLDILPASRPAAPVLVFIHGGYWRGGTKESRRFPARTFNALGVTWVTVGYPLCPQVSIESIVESVRRAVAWLARNISRFGGDPSRIFVCGNSAGGHLVAMLAAAGWAKAHGLQSNPVKGGVSISPLADLRVFVDHPFNETFRLTTDAAARMSPVLLEIERDVPLVIAVGGLETPAFHWQSRILAESRAARGASDVQLTVPNRDHFSIGEDLDDAGSALTAAVLKQMGLR